jgi:hypothetical protein
MIVNFWFQVKNQFLIALKNLMGNSGMIKPDPIHQSATDRFFRGHFKQLIFDGATS